MIRTSRQLKDLIRNLSQSSGIPQYLLIRRYMMDRFLERLSVSPYREKFILKGGMLVSEIVGIHARATKDIDTTVKGLPLTKEHMKNVIDDIISVDVQDNIIFRVTSVDTIMDEADYEGIRIGLEAKFDGSVTPMKIDISTNDIITPQEVVYEYKLMLEDRTISILAYPLETVLAEKIETLLSRAETNTRMRDFYDIHILSQSCESEIEYQILGEALAATAGRRGTTAILDQAESVLNALESSFRMEELWKRYQAKNSYTESFSWQEVMSSTRKLCLKSGLNVSQ